LVAALGVAIAIPAVPLIAGLAISSGSSKAALPPNGNRYTAVATATTTAPAKTRPTAPHERLPAGRGTLVAFVLARTALRATPGGHVLKQIGTRTTFGSPQVLWVVRDTPRWLGVISSDAGNGRVGWIARSVTSLSRVRWQINVSLSSHAVSVLEDGRLIHRYEVAIGRPSAPTPAGRFAVTDRLTTGDPSGPYGCCILALSAHAPHAIQGWSGGDRIAIHSTPDTSSIGLPVSHGCLRLTLAEGRWLIDHIPLGTPTIIST
jgi:lipoprotein-anchoring transpeptidase ErfK/SrfK